MVPEEEFELANVGMGVEISLRVDTLASDDELVVRVFDVDSVTIPLHVVVAEPSIVRILASVFPSADIIVPPSNTPRS